MESNKQISTGKANTSSKALRIESEANSRSPSTAKDTCPIHKLEK